MDVSNQGADRLDQLHREEQALQRNARRFCIPKEGWPELNER